MKTRLRLFEKKISVAHFWGNTLKKSLWNFYFRRYVRIPAEDDKWWMVEKDGKLVNENSDDEKDSEEDKQENDGMHLH